MGELENSFINHDQMKNAVHTEISQIFCIFSRPGVVCVPRLVVSDYLQVPSAPTRAGADRLIFRGENGPEPQNSRDFSAFLVRASHMNPTGICSSLIRHPRKLKPSTAVHSTLNHTLGHRSPERSLLFGEVIREQFYKPEIQMYQL